MTLSEFHKQIGRNVKALRTKRKLTQSELGKLVNNRKQNIYHWERGKPMTTTTIFNLSKALKVEPRDLIPRI